MRVIQLVLAGAAIIVALASAMVCYRQRIAMRAACLEQYRLVLCSVVSRYPPLSMSLESDYSALTPAKPAQVYVCYRWSRAELRFGLRNGATLELPRGPYSFKLSDARGAAELQRMLTAHFAQPQNRPLLPLYSFQPDMEKTTPN